MALAVLHVVGAQWRAHVALPWAGVLFLVVATPLGGVIVDPAPVWAAATKAVLYAAIATLTVGALVLGAPNGMRGCWPADRWCGWRDLIELFLLHAVVMAVTMNLVLRWPLFTGSLAGLYVATLAVTIPLAWALHRVTGRGGRDLYTRTRNEGTNSASARPRCDAESFSSGVSCAAVRDDPSGMNTGS